MGKKVFSLCMALVLCLGLLPATALAAAPSGQELYVGNVQISSTGYWTTDSDGSVTQYTEEGTPSDNYIHYDKDNNTLTLHNATIKESVSTDTSTFIAGAAIGVHNQNGAAELTITLEGTNTIAEVGKGIYVLANSTGGATLTITGDGSLDASARQTGIWVQSNSGNATLTIRNAKVEATGTSTVGYGVNVQSSNSSTAALTVDGGSLTASGSPGILYDSIGSGTVPNTTALTISNSAIVDAREGGIGAGLLQDLKEVSPADNSVGIVFGLDLSDSKAGTVYGSVTLQEDLEIGEGESLDIPSGASLTIKDGITLTVDGGELTGNNIPPDGVVYKVTEVKLDENSLTLDVGKSETLTATITPDNATNKAVEWKSDDTSVATVDENGKVTAVAQGSTTITATAADGSGKSAECSVTVNAPATTITTQPSNVTVTEGETATFSVTATGSNLTYQWQQNTDGGNNWTDISSATGSSYTTQATTAAMSGYQYRCKVTGTGGEATSNAATLTVTAPPEPTPPPYIPPTYAVTTPETPGGTVTVSPSRASSGRTVTITAAPDTGFALESLTVLDSRGNEIALTDKGDGKYTFTMPASRVTVEASFTPAPLPFEDVAPGAWYEEAVRYAYFHNIMEGMSETEFSPTTALTRAMAVQILYNLEGQPDLSDENLGYPYEDVDAQAWYGDAVYWARITGVATGYGDGTFQPGDSITRQEFAQMLYNYAKYKGYDLTAAGDLSQFPDSESVADWAEAAMRWANGNQLINGHDDGTIDAAGIGTRAQAASILMKFDQNLVEN